MTFLQKIIDTVLINYLKYSPFEILNFEYIKKNMSTEAYNDLFRVAVEKNDEASIHFAKYLLESGKDKITDEAYSFAFVTAVKNDNQHFVKYLSPQVEHKITNEAYNAAFEFTAKEYREDLLNFFIINENKRISDEEYSTVFEAAIKEGNNNCVKFLVEKGANRITHETYTSALKTAAREDETLAEHLLKNGKNKITDAEYSSIFTTAAKHWDTDFAIKILKEGKDRITDEAYNSAFQILVGNTRSSTSHDWERGSEDLAKVLIEKVNERITGETYVSALKHILLFFNEPFAKHLLKHGKDKITDAEYNDIFKTAVKNGHANFAKFAIEKGEDRITNETYNFAFKFAVGDSGLVVIQEESKRSIGDYSAKYAIKQHFNTSGVEDFVKVLIKKVPNRITDETYNSSFKDAVKGYNKNLAKFLVEEGKSRISKESYDFAFKFAVENSRFVTKDEYDGNVTVEEFAKSLIKEKQGTTKETAYKLAAHMGAGKCKLEWPLIEEAILLEAQDNWTMEDFARFLMETVPNSITDETYESAFKTIAEHHNRPFLEYFLKQRGDKITDEIYNSAFEGAAQDTKFFTHCNGSNHALLIEKEKNATTEKVYDYYRFVQYLLRKGSQKYAEAVKGCDFDKVELRHNTDKECAKFLIEKGKDKITQETYNRAFESIAKECNEILERQLPKTEEPYTSEATNEKCDEDFVRFFIENAEIDKATLCTSPFKNIAEECIA